MGIELRENREETTWITKSELDCMVVMVIKSIEN